MPRKPKAEKREAIFVPLHEDYVKHAIEIPVKTIPREQIEKIEKRERIEIIEKPEKEEISRSPSPPNRQSRQDR